jgi:hypothetical protein
MSTPDKQQQEAIKDQPFNKDRQGTDKNPEEGRGDKEVVKPDNLKGKKVYGFPDSEIDTPLNEIP